MQFRKTVLGFWLAGLFASGGSAAPITFQLPNKVDEQSVSTATPLPTAPGQGSTYKLLTNASASGSAVPNVVGASYVWCIQGTIGGATIALQALGPDGVNYITVSSQTAAGCYGVVLGANATVKVTVTGGTPSGLYSSLS